MDFPENKQLRRPPIEGDGQAEALATLFIRCGVQSEKARVAPRPLFWQMKHSSEALILDAEHPDRDDGAENGQARNGPPGSICPVIRGPFDHGIMPFAHESLPEGCLSLSASLTSWSKPEAEGSIR